MLRVIYRVSVIIMLIISIACVPVNSKYMFTGEKPEVPYIDKCVKDSECDFMEICNQGVCMDIFTHEINHKHFIDDDDYDENDGNYDIIIYGTVAMLVASTILAFVIYKSKYKGGYYGTKCCDGTYSNSSGSGTCSHHGGVCD